MNTEETGRAKETKIGTMTKKDRKSKETGRQERQKKQRIVKTELNKRIQRRQEGQTNKKINVPSRPRRAGKDIKQPQIRMTLGMFYLAFLSLSDRRNKLPTLDGQHHP